MTSEPKTVAEVLRAAAELIAPEGRWTTHYNARNARGEARHAAAEDAVCWCAIGAIRRVSGDDDKTYDAAVAAMRQAMGRSRGIGDWNDSVGQAEVVSALTRAAVLAEANQ